MAILWLWGKGKQLVKFENFNGNKVVYIRAQHGCVGALDEDETLHWFQGGFYFLEKIDHIRSPILLWTPENHRRQPKHIKNKVMFMLLMCKHGQIQPKLPEEILFLIFRMLTSLYSSLRCRINSSQSPLDLPQNHS